jgi:hypothetical protein
MLLGRLMDNLPVARVILGPGSQALSAIDQRAGDEGRATDRIAGRCAAGA